MERAPFSKPPLKPPSTNSWKRMVSNPVSPKIAISCYFAGVSTAKKEPRSGIVARSTLSSPLAVPSSECVWILRTWID